MILRTERIHQKLGTLLVRHRSVESTVLAPYLDNVPSGCVLDAGLVCGRTNAKPVLNQHNQRLALHISWFAVVASHLGLRLGLQLANFLLCH